VAGVMVMHYIWPGLYEAITRWSVPALGINAEPVPGMPVVSTDWAHGAAEAVGHLAGLGHRRIAFLPGTRRTAFMASKVQAKTMGYVRGMDKAGLPLFRKQPVNPVPCV
jgi:DNA-binding LacI/PurR family transcriptional regulator